MYLQRRDPPLPTLKNQTAGRPEQLGLLGQLGATVDIDRAIRENRKWTKKLGWDKHRSDIVKRVLHITRKGVSVSTTDDKTLAQAVADWQERFCFPRPSGILGRGTWAEMKILLGLSMGKNSGKFKVIDAVLPRAGFGYCSSKPVSHRWGLPETIQALESIGIDWYWLFPGGPRIRIGDVARRGGGAPGSFSPHKSHHLGLDVDIGLMRSDTHERTVNFKTNPKKYSQSRTQKLVDILRKNSVLKVADIFFDDPGVKGVRKIESSPHNNHMHVRFCIPSRYKKIKGKGFERCQ